MEASPLDYVAQSCMDLTEALNGIDNESEGSTLILNHIKKVWSTVAPIEDFKKSQYTVLTLFILFLGYLVECVRPEHLPRIDFQISVE